MRAPPSLRKGQTVEVVAPSGPFDSDELRSGLTHLADFDLHIPDGLFGRREGFFAGNDQVRFDELQAALDRPDAGAVLIARGGYGLARIAPRLSWAGFLKSPKWIVGFSDATVLHAQIAKQGFMSLHAPNGTTLSRSTEEELRQLISLLTAPIDQVFEGLEPWVEGDAEGSLFGGNLTVLFAEAAANRLVVPDGCVLFVEDVTETSYRIDRMLDALRAGGHLQRVSAVLLGDFHECSPGKFDVPTEEVLRSNLCKLGVPVLAGLPIGHGERNHPLVLGATASVLGSQCRVHITPE